jgi:hypothetical protein
VTPLKLSASRSAPQIGGLFRPAKGEVCAQKDALDRR